MKNKYLNILLLGLIVFGLGSLTVPAPEVQGMTLGDLGKQMVAAGVIDRGKFLALYDQRPELRERARKFLDEDNIQVEITQENSRLMLNFFWALGLSNQNPILEMEMMDPRYGG